MMHQCSPGELLAGIALVVHHDDSSGAFQPRRVGMMLECSTGELLTRAAFMHYGDQEHNALKHYAALKGLRTKGS